jgi:uncharacterized protein
MNFIKRSTFQKPIFTGIILMLIALSFRLIDIFVLRLDERLGEIILSKALSFCLVLGFVWAIGKQPSSIYLSSAEDARIDRLENLRQPRVIR